jgi:hypothetical protein
MPLTDTPSSTASSPAPPTASSPAPRHSGLGIASFVISLVAGALLLLFVGIAGVLTVSGGLDENSPQAVMLGLLIITILIVVLVALGLGIGGLVQRERKKIFAALGTIFSAAIFLGGVLLIVVGALSGD